MAQGVFEGGLPWGMVGIGAALAVVIIGVDLWLESKGSTFRTPVLAVAVGIYLPFELSVPILFGGLIAHRAVRKLRDAPEEARATGERRGLLFAAGLITGEALVGIVMAVPIVVTGDRDVLALFGAHHSPWPGLALLLLVMVALYRVARAKTLSPS